MHHTQTSLFQDYNPTPSRLKKKINNTNNTSKLFTAPKNNYIFEPKVSCSPSKIVVYNEVSIFCRQSGYFIPLSKEKKHTNLTRAFHNFELSDNAVRTLKKKINWLFFLSKSRNIITIKKKSIPSFKIGFYTFTLPSTQVHNTGTIVSEIWSQFVNELSKYNGMKNYIWRLEFQENKNVHFHLVSDKYLDWYMLRRKWNTACNKLGYVDKYQKKMQNMSLSQYISTYADNKSNSYTILSKRFARGKKENWSNPNSVDVKPVKSNNAIAYYISKYITKPSPHSEKNENNNTIRENHFNDLDSSYNSKNVRLWFCSRSLSKLENITNYLQEMNFDPLKQLRNLSGVKTVIRDYCVILFLDFKTLANEFKCFYSRLLRDYANSLEYSPSP